MGAWSVSITGNDTAQDLRSEYQAAFFYNDVDTALEKLEAYVRQEFKPDDEDEWCNYYYSLADYMWKHGILTETIRDRVLSMIDSGYGLELYEEAGAKVLEKRNKVLADFRTKLLSPQPPKKKIRINLYLHPVFETGDLVAIQLQTAKKYYIENRYFDEQTFRDCDGKYIVLRKVMDHVGFTSSVEPNVKDYWAVFQLYGKIFDTCPAAEELRGVPWADTTAWACQHFRRKEKPSSVFHCESSMFHFKRQKCVVIGNDLTEFPNEESRLGKMICLGVSHEYLNAEVEFLAAILG